MMHTHQDPAIRKPGPVSTPYQAVVDMPLSGVNVRLGIRMRDGVLTGIEILGGAAAPRFPTDAVTTEVVRQLEGYFRNPQQGFSLPLMMAGTSYQRRVWEALRTIPAGGTLTYGELAQQVGGGARAVGGACRRNPVPIVVPCHRVVSVTGLGGYMGETTGAGLALKARLLAHEAGSSWPV